MLRFSYTEGSTNKQCNTGGYTASVGVAIYPFFYLYARSYLPGYMLVLTYGVDSNYTLLQRKEICWDNKLTPSPLQVISPGVKIDAIKNASDKCCQERDQE